MWSVEIVFCVILQICIAAKLPSDWHRCIEGEGFEDCMKEAIEFAVKSMASEGLTAFGVLPLDPMHFDRLVIDQSSGPVAIKLEFQNIDVTGIKDLLVKQLKGNWSRFDVETLIPVPLSLIGEYTVEGKVLSLPIVGSGHCNLTFHNFEWHPITLQFEEQTKKGKRYIHISDISLIPRTSLLQMEFLNLFNGDKTLGTQMNIFLNENWSEIFDELKPAVSKAFGTAYRDVGNRILSRVPADAITSQ